MAKSAWGIDLSKYSMKCVQVSKGKGGLELRKICVIEYPTEAVEGAERTVEEKFADALRQFLDQYSVRGSRILFSLPGHSIFNRLVKLPPVEREKIPEVVRFEAQSQIPFAIDDVIWDYQLVERQYGPGEEMEAIIFAIKKDIIEQFLDQLKQLHLEIDGIQFAPVALYNFLKRDQDTGAPCVAMDMGADNTDLIILDGQKFWIRNLPVTGNDITKSLQKAFSLSFGDAEKLKVRAGQSQQAQKIFTAIQPTLKDLVSETHRTIGYYKSITKGVKFDKIFLLGNASKTVNFQRFVSQSLQLQAFRLTRLNNIAVAPEIDEGTLQRYLPTMGAAIGLALQGLGETYNNVNLLPRPYLKEKEQKKRRPFVVGALAALFLLFFLLHRSQQRTVRELAVVDGNVRDTLRIHDQVQKEFDTVSNMEQMTGRLETMASISRGRDRNAAPIFLERLNALLKDRVSDIADDRSGLFKLMRPSSDGKKYEVTDPKADDRVWVLGIESETVEEVVAPPPPPPGTPPAPPPPPGGKETDPKKDPSLVAPPKKNRFLRVAAVLSFASKGDQPKDQAYIKSIVGDKIALQSNLPLNDPKVYEVYPMPNYYGRPAPVTAWGAGDLGSAMPDLQHVPVGGRYAICILRWKIPLGHPAPGGLPPGEPEKK